MDGMISVDYIQCLFASERFFLMPCSSMPAFALSGWFDLFKKNQSIWPFSAGKPFPFISLGDRYGIQRAGSAPGQRLLSLFNMLNAQQSFPITLIGGWVSLYRQTIRINDICYDSTFDYRNMLSNINNYFDKWFLCRLSTAVLSSVINPNSAFLANPFNVFRCIRMLDFVIVSILTWAVEIYCC